MFFYGGDATKNSPAAVLGYDTGYGGQRFYTHRRRQRDSMVFLHLDDQLSLLELLLQTCILSLKRTYVLRLIGRIRDRTTGFVRYGFLCPLPRPGGQVGGIETFSSQQGSDLSGPRAPVGFIENALLVGGTEATTLGSC